jgi:hypothetical protein
MERRMTRFVARRATKLSNALEDRASLLEDEIAEQVASVSLTDLKPSRSR